MNKKLRIKVTIDVCMTIVLLFLMAYEMVGEVTHEVLGVIMFALFVIHHVLNRKWTANILKGRYTPFRVIQTTLVLLIFAGMIGSAVSGIILSKHVFAALPIEGGSYWARNIHILCGNWNFVLMSLHLGLHWNMMLTMAMRGVKRDNKVLTWGLRLAGFAIAGYGIYAFAKRQVGLYLTGQLMFAFFDYSEPVIFFILDYITIMGVFVFIGHYTAALLKQLSNR